MFITGLDLGQALDYTAIAVVEGEPVTLAGKQRYTYTLGHLERPELGTRYPEIVERVQTLRRTAPLSPQAPLVVDATGVGRPVVDMFAREQEAAFSKPVAVTITGGTETKKEETTGASGAASGEHWHVPKRVLISTLDMLFHSDLLKIADGMREGPALVKELLNFRRKVSLTTAHESFESWRETDHDDLVLAVALACWYGENPNEPDKPIYKPSYACVSTRGFSGGRTGLGWTL